MTTYLDAIEKRLRAATPGHWYVRSLVGKSDVRCGAKVVARLLHINKEHERDAALIAHAPTDIERLIKAHRVMAAAIDWASDTTAEGTTRRHLDGARAEVSKIMEGV